MVKSLRYFFLLVFTLGTLTVFAQDEGFVYGDLLPDAPELAARGDYAVGVRTLEWVNPNQIDLANLSAENPTAAYDRPLTVEVWYPAIVPDGSSELTTYESYFGRADQDNVEAFSFAGRALRDAEPDTSGGAYPLVIVSHGFPGDRYMMSYLTENLASKGYVVIAIDHTDSTFADTGSFFSTLLFRAIDQNFVLNEAARMSGEDTFMNGLVDADNTAIIGYSMGGYGTLNSVGAGYNSVLQGFLPVIESRMEGNETYEASIDSRIKAVVVFAPWGGDLSAFNLPDTGFWDVEALGTISVPSLWVAGSLDDVSGYDAIVGLFDSAVSSERYLLTYDNALHNVAPNPPPSDVRGFGDYERYSEPAWDERRINNINQHFVTAFLGQYLKGGDYAAYLNPAVENANEGVFSDTSDSTYWAGFLPRTATGMTLRTEAPE
ncbi:MAG: dienelactone hydrolase [Anaerolineae bacterium]|nr:dienelactone hydrolase [Anaerolineae bacterium]